MVNNVIQTHCSVGCLITMPTSLKFSQNTNDSADSSSALHEQNQENQKKSNY